MAVKQEVLEGIREQLGYNDAEWEMWLGDPKNLEIAESAEEFHKWLLIAEVIKSRGCGNGHKVGDRFIFNGNGALVGKEPPGPVCMAALGPILPKMNAIWSGLAAGLEPRKTLLFNKVRCLDIGVENGGWGEVLMQLKLEKVDQD